MFVLHAQIITSVTCKIFSLTSAEVAGSYRSLGENTWNIKIICICYRIVMKILQL